MWNNLSCRLLLVVLALFLFRYLYPAMKNTEIKVDKNLLSDGVKLKTLDFKTFSEVVLLALFVLHDDFSLAFRTFKVGAPCLI